MSPLPPRIADTMSDAIALSSPSGRMSKRARRAASERLRRALFGDATAGDIRGRAAETPAARAARLCRYAATLCHLATGGMKPRVHRREAARLEAEAAALDGHRDFKIAEGG